MFSAYFAIELPQNVDITTNVIHFCLQAYDIVLFNNSIYTILLVKKIPAGCHKTFERSSAARSKPRSNMNLEVSFTRMANFLVILFSFFFGKSVILKK